MSLPAYIEKHGVDECARKWRVSKRTVHYWKEGTIRPQKRKLPILIKTTGLTRAEIYG